MRTPAEQGPSASLGYQLWQAGLRWQRVLAAALRPLDLTPTRFAVLGGLYWLTRDGQEPPSQVQLARQACLDPVMTSKIVRTLVEEGLVRRRDDPADSRAYRLTLTAAGRARAARGVEALLAAEGEFFGSLGLDLLRLREAMEAISGAHGPAGADR